jgi:hypothetical protein
MNNSIEKELSNYEINFDSCFTEKEMKEEFYKYLQKEFATENFDFIEDYHKLCEMTDEKEYIQATIDIITTYIVDYSPKEVNLAGAQKQKVVHTFNKSKQKQSLEKWVIEETPAELFYDCKRSLYSTLNHDTFKRFIRSPEFFKFIPKHLKNSNIAQARMSHLFSYKDEDFHKDLVTDKDFDFMRVLMKDGFDWEVVGRKHEYDSMLTSYFTTINYLLGCQFTRRFSVNPVKYETVLHFPFHQAVALFPLKSFYDMDPNTNRIDTINYMPSDGETYTRDHYTSRTTCQFPLLNYRVFNAVVSTDYNPKKRQLIQILKSRTEEEIPYGSFGKQEVCVKKGGQTFKKTKAYNMFTFMAIVIERFDDYKTNYTQILLCGLGGWCDNVKMAKAITHDRGVKSKRSLVKKLKETPIDMSWDEMVEKFGDDSMMKELISCEGLEDDYNQSYQFCNFRRKQSCYQLKELKI